MLQIDNSYIKIDTNSKKLDSYDSFVFNLQAYMKEPRQETYVRCTNAIDIDDIARMKPDEIILSPVPDRPFDAALSLSVLQKYGGAIPILGICLGHQAIDYASGAVVEKGSRPMHGKITPVFHTGKDLFRHLPSPF